MLTKDNIEYAHIFFSTLSFKLLDTINERGSNYVREKEASDILWYKTLEGGAIYKDKEGPKLTDEENAVLEGYCKNEIRDNIVNLFNSVLSRYSPDYLLSEYNKLLDYVEEGWRK